MVNGNFKKQKLELTWIGKENLKHRGLGRLPDHPETKPNPRGPTLLHYFVFYNHLQGQQK